MKVMSGNPAACYETAKRTQDAMSSRLLWLRLCREHYEYAPDSFKNRFLPSTIVGDPLMSPAPSIEFKELWTEDAFEEAWKPPQIADIKRLVCRHYRITHADLISERRDAKTCRPRFVAIYLARAFTPHSMPEIGRRFGGRDHSSIVNAINRINKLMATDDALKSLVQKLGSRLAA